MTSRTDNCKSQVAMAQAAAGSRSASFLQAYWSVPRLGRDGFVALLRRGWIALFVAFLFLRSAIHMFVNEANRMYFHWQRSDALAITGLIVVVGVAIFALYETVGRLGRPGRLLRDLAFVVIGFFYLRVAVLESIYPSGFIPVTPVRIVKIIHLLLLAAFLLRPAVTLRLLSGLFLILSPIMPIYMARIAVARPYIYAVPAAQESLAGQKQPPANARNIHIVILDGCSYQLVFRDGDVDGAYPNLGRMAAESVVFHNAYSPGERTIISVPAMLCGVMDAVDDEHHPVVTERVRRAGKSAQPEHLFALMRDRGYRPVWYGYYLTMDCFTRRDLPEGETWTIYKRLGRHPAAVAATLLVSHSGRRLGQWFPYLVSLRNRMVSTYKAQFDAWIQSKALQTMRDPRPTFSLLHYRIPHSPFIHDDDGLVSNPDRIRDGDGAAFAGAMLAADRDIGVLLDALRNQPWNDETLLILTSDHALRDDPDAVLEENDGDHLLRVPLLVMFPGQTNRLDVTERVELIRLKNALVRFVDEGITPQEFAAELGVHHEN